MIALTSYQLGRLVGALLVVVLVPGFLVFLGIRLRRRGSGVWWIPIVLAILLVAGGVGYRVMEATRTLEQLSTIRAVDAENAFPSGTDYGFEPIRDKSVTEAIEGLLRREFPSGDVAARVVMKEGEPFAFAVALTAPRRAFVDTESFLDGFARGIAEESGRQPIRRIIGGRLVFEFEVSESNITLFSTAWHRPGTNVMMMVMAPTLTDSRDLAAAIIRTETSTPSPA